MNKVKVAVLDTGLDIYDNELSEKYVYDSSIQLGALSREKINDSNGHGTFVSKVILNISKNVVIYPVNIFNNNGRTSSLDLLNSLIKLLKSDIKIINISATSVNSRYEKELKRVCDTLSSQGKIIICSKHNKCVDRDSIPTIFRTVIGVEGHKDIFKNNQYLYKKGEKIQMYANSKDCFLKFKDQVTHFGRNSKACAVVTGIISNIVKDDPQISFDDIEKKLLKNSLSEKELSKKLKREYFFTLPKVESLEIENKLINLINTQFAREMINIDFIKRYSLMNNFTDIGKGNAYKFLESINEEFHINISYKDILLCDLEEIERLKEIIGYYLYNKKL